MSISSALTPSEVSSVNSRARDLHCHACKSAHAPTYNPLTKCGSCRRQYHQACRKPMTASSEHKYVTATFRVLSCTDHNLRPQLGSRGSVTDVSSVSRDAAD